MPSPILIVVLLLVVLAVISFIPMDPRLRTLFQIILLIFVLLGVLAAFGLLGPMFMGGGHWGDGHYRR